MKKSSTMEKSNCFYLGKIVKKFSFRGEVILRIAGEISNDYLKIKTVYLTQNSEKLINVEVVRAKWQKANHLRLAFKDVEDEAAAHALLGKEAYLPITSLPPTTNNNCHFHELVGFEVFNKTHFIGKLTSINRKSPQPLFEVAYQGKIILVPAHENLITKVDRLKKRLLLTLPEGLVELYL